MLQRLNLNKFKMNKCVFIICILFLFGLGSKAQFVEKPIHSGEITSFEPILEFLASPLLEGRETGSREAEIAAEYIASMMKKAGLEPYLNSNSSLQGFDSYFQKFDLLKFTLEKAVVSVTSFGNGQRPIMLNPFTDYNLMYGFESVNVESPVVFAGYGIAFDELGYNDYKDVDVQGKVALILEGYPGDADTNGTTWKKFAKAANRDAFNFEQKCKEALRHGAVAVILINKQWILNNQFDNENNGNSGLTYPDSDFVLPSEKPAASIPVFVLTKNASGRISNTLGIDASDKAREIARKFQFKPYEEKNAIRISLKIKEETLEVSNVIGQIKGADTTQTILLGAHYDHLGKRGNAIYCGADDNASGVAGLLALAESWANNQQPPSCNIMFASWVAEEKGLIGSRYYAGKLQQPQKTRLYINMDMISRSTQEDAKQNQLSIGTRSSDEYLRKMAQSINATLSKPFELDLWDVTGHSGSDYGSFTVKNIPIMTYNSGLHNDYHTPRDQAQSVDFAKMRNVLSLVNACLIYYLNTLPAEK